MRVVIIILFSLLCTQANNVEILVPMEEYTPLLADFRTSFNYILEHEGYYVNHPDDRGKETYAGISRRYNPNWYGWRHIDAYKRQNAIKWNTRLPELDHWVLDYYLDIWVKEGFYMLQDQEVANQVLDFRVNGTIGAIIIQKTLNEMGCDVKITNKIDSATIANINNVDPCKFKFLLGINRAVFYTKTALNNENQKQFLNHWIFRTKR